MIPRADVPNNTVRLAAVSGLADFPCTDCGRPSVGWCVREDVEDGIEVLTGYAVCELHIPAGLEES